MSELGFERRHSDFRALAASTTPPGISQRKPESPAWKLQGGKTAVMKGESEPKSAPRGLLPHQLEPQEELGRDFPNILCS